MFGARRRGGWGQAATDSIALFALNAAVCRELFVTEYTRHMGSIEGAYIGISRWAMENPFEFGWFPLWYGGVPYQNTYPPVLHWLVALAAWALGISTALSHHAVTAVFYCLGAVAVYALARTLGGSRAVALWAALAWSLVSPTAFVLDDKSEWLQTIWGPVRLASLVEWGDGPHITAVALLPLALIALHRALEKPAPRRVYLAAFGLAAVVLTNWLGAFALALAAASYLLARSGGRDWGRLVARSIGIALLAYAMAMPWAPPSTVSDVRHNAQHVIGEYPMTAAQLGYWALLAAATLALWTALRRLRASPLTAFSAYFALFTGALIFGSAWCGVHLMPQPDRYHHEFEMAACLLFASLAVPRLARLPFGWRAAAAALAGGLLVSQYAEYRRQAEIFIQPAEIEQTVERRVARWLEERLPGARVFASGSVQFWMTAFADVPQLGGGYGQGVVNRHLPALHFGLTWTEGDGADGATWLRLFGVDAVVVGGPAGRDAYAGEWRDPRKFDGVLPELWRDGDDAIYGVPRPRRSLAHAIGPERVVRRRPINNEDLEPVRPLADALGDPALPAVSLEWDGPSRAVARGDFSGGKLLYFQATYHPGWRARVDGEPRPLRADGLGQIVVEPGCERPCAVELIYDGGHEGLLARLAAWLALAGGLAWAAGRRLRR